MNRRSFLAAAGASLGPVAGCSSSGGRTSEPKPPTCADGESWEPTVRTEDLTLEPGGFAVLDIHLERIRGLYFEPGLYGCGTDPPVALGDIDHDPEPVIHLDGCPPGWVCDGCTVVDLHVPVDVAADADPSRYELAFSVSGGAEDSEREYGVTITVSTGSGSLAGRPR